MKLDDVGVIDLGQDPKLFLQELDIFLYIFFQDTLHCILDLGVSDPVGDAYRAEVTTAYELFKSVNSPDVCSRKGLLDFFKDLRRGICQLIEILDSWLLRMSSIRHIMRLWKLSYCIDLISLYISISRDWLSRRFNHFDIVGIIIIGLLFFLSNCAILIRNLSKSIFQFNNKRW